MVADDTETGNLQPAAVRVRCLAQQLQGSGRVQVLEGLQREFISLLALAESGPEQMSACAKTPVGDALAGTAFIVTSRDDGH
jgi:hypothetical protein